ncbi:MAG: hypothetical protein ACK4HM_06030 [Thermosynechococcus sp.]
MRQEYIIPADTAYPDYAKQQKALTKAKEENPKLRGAHSQVLQDALRRVDKAFKRSNSMPKEVLVFLDSRSLVSIAHYF